MELSVHTFLTLDGVMQGPGGPDEDRSGGFDRGGWIVPLADEEFGPIVDDWFTRADAILLGRTTYQVMQAYWTTVTDPENPVASALNTYPKYVVSTTLSEATWDNSTLISDDVVESVQALKEEPGREVQVHGSWQLARTLHDAGLVDVYRLMIFPVVVGSGKRLFDASSTPSGFDVVTATTTSTGIAYLELRPVGFQAGEYVVEDGKETVA